MGGRGSGNWYRWDKKTTIEETRRIDIRYLKKRGFLWPGVSGSLSWNRGGEPTGNIWFSMNDSVMNLDYKVQEYGDTEWQPVKQEIQIARTPCNYGGYRKWLVCPRCQRRVAVLCMVSSRFYCRHCWRLSYGSQSECVVDRMIRARDRLAGRIFEGDSYRRRKGMHRVGFEKLADRFFQLDEEIDWQICLRFRLLEGGGELKI